MSATTLEVKQINGFNGSDEFDELDSFGGINEFDDGTTQLIEAITCERDYYDCAYYDSAW